MPKRLLNNMLKIDFFQFYKNTTMSDLSKMTNHFLKKECREFDIPWPNSREKAIKLLYEARTTGSFEKAERKRRRDRDEYLVKGWELYANEGGTEYNGGATLKLLMCEIVNYTCTMEIETTVVNVTPKPVQEIESELIHPDICWQPWVPNTSNQIDWIKIGEDFANKKYLW